MSATALLTDWRAAAEGDIEARQRCSQILRASFDGASLPTVVQSIDVLCAMLADPVAPLPDSPGSALQAVADRLSDQAVVVAAGRALRDWLVRGHPMAELLSIRAWLALLPADSAQHLLSLEWLHWHEPSAAPSSVSSQRVLAVLHRLGAVPLVCEQQPERSVPASPASAPPEASCVDKDPLGASPVDRRDWRSVPEEGLSLGHRLYLQEVRELLLSAEWALATLHRQRHNGAEWLALTRALKAVSEASAAMGLKAAASMVREPSALIDDALDRAQSLDDAELDAVEASMDRLFVELMELVGERVVLSPRPPRN